MTAEVDADSWLMAIAAGDSSAFGRWMSTTEPALRRVLRPFARKVDAEAVLQETFLRIWQVAPRVTRDGRPNALLRLAQVTARNLALSELRRARVNHQEVEALGAMTEQVVCIPALPDPMLRGAILE